MKPAGQRLLHVHKLETYANAGGCLAPRDPIRGIRIKATWKLCHMWDVVNADNIFYIVIGRIKVTLFNGLAAS